MPPEASEDQIKVATQLLKLLSAKQHIQIYLHGFLLLNRIINRLNRDTSRGGADERKKIKDAKYRYYLYTKLTDDPGKNHFR